MYTDNPEPKGIGTRTCKGAGTEVATSTTALEEGIHNITYTDKIGGSESGQSPALQITIDPPALTDHFVTTWYTEDCCETNATSIKVPMVGGPYDVDWDNDGTFDEFDLTGPVVHDFGVVGTYTIRIRGDFDSIRFEWRGDQGKIRSIRQWGTHSWSTMERAFAGAWHLQITATDVPDFSATVNMSHMFNDAGSVNPDTSNWDTSSVSNTQYMFAGAMSFDRDLGSWDVSALKYAEGMFAGVTLSTANYESLLVGWNKQSVQPNVTFNGGNSTFCSAAAYTAWDNLMASDGWTILDGGQDCPNCKLETVSGTIASGPGTHESCEALVIGPTYLAEDGADINLSSGESILLLPEFLIEQGAVLDVNVCGQSLCEVSDKPMPWGCHSCVDQICEFDSSCCGLAFDQACVDYVNSVCGLTCE